MASPIRAFVAIALPENIIAHVRRVQRAIRPSAPGVRWISPHNLHVTLKFLGNIDGAQIAAVGRALDAAAAAQPPFSLILRGLGVFPDMRRPRVIWMGMGGQLAALKNLCLTAEQHMQNSGFAAEKRPFTGHLTIGRTKGRIAAEPLDEAMAACSGHASDPFEVDRIILFQSDLQPRGPVYTQLLSATLSPRTSMRAE